MTWPTRASAAVVLLALIATAACNTGTERGSRRARTITRSVPTTLPVPTTTPSTSTTIPPLPSPSSYSPLPGEPAPEVKAAAARFLEVLTTYDIGGGTLLAADQRLVSAGLNPASASEAAPLLIADAASSGEVIYPQLGGLTASEASVMVVLHDTTRRLNKLSAVERTVDVRLVRGPGGWAVSALASIGGDAHAGPSLASPLAQQVLENRRISMSDTSRWDLLAGRVDDRVSQLLLGIAASRTLSITVFATGHPEKVFGTAAVSNHTRGRGVDIWAIDGQPISQLQGDGSIARLVVADALKAGATEVGSPWDLDGPRSASFTNTVHDDHLHLAFER